jgi:hypothetical protein
VFQKLEDKQVQFPKHYVFLYLEFRMMDRAQRHSNSELTVCLRAVFCSHALCRCSGVGSVLLPIEVAWLRALVWRSISNCGTWGYVVWFAVVWHCVCRLRSQWPVACLTVLETNGRLNAVPSSLCASWDMDSSVRCGRGSGTTQRPLLSRHWNQVSCGSWHSDPKVLVSKVVTEMVY